MKSNNIWAKSAITALMLSILSYLLWSFIYYSLYSLLDEQAIGFGYNSATTTLEFFLIQIEPILSFATIISFIIWFYRVYANLHILQSTNMNFSKKWAIACWFVPIINFQRPFEITKEIWGKTQPIPEKTASNERPPLLNLWWIFFLLQILVIFVSLPLYEQGNTTEGAKTLYFALICSQFVHIIAALLAIIVVFKINQQEKRMLRNVKERDIYDHLVEK